MGWAFFIGRNYPVVPIITNDNSNKPQTHTMTGTLNGKKYSIHKTTPNRLKQLDDASEMLADYNENNDGFYLYNEEFRAKFLRQLAGVVMDFKDGLPDEDFFADEDLEVSEIIDARRAFLSGAGVM